MKEIGLRPSSASVADVGLSVAVARWNLSPSEMIEEALRRGEGRLAASGALVVDTGEFTGRSPLDRFIVRDGLTGPAVDWGDVNLPFSPSDFDLLYKKISAYFSGKDVFVKDAYACADGDYRLNIRVVTEMAYQALFVHNLFLRPSYDELLHHRHDWVILVAPGFKADPAADGTRGPNFTILDFSRRRILIGGTGYTGEIKKAVFSVLNYLLPLERQVLPMHCAANTGARGDTAIFFGLSGTGKTTLSADPSRRLVGDDEHGWSERGVFNFEGGCYAKCVNLEPEKEPQIHGAIRFGSLLENTAFLDGSRKIDFFNTEKTENSRAAYPVDYIDNAVRPSRGDHPRHIFFLTADAFGVLPPISRLSIEQAMYYFLSGYTAKVAGTETGVTEPQATFSACFGKAFLPLHPATYAGLLGMRLARHRSKVWLVNTGWTGGPYGTGRRMRLEHTRTLVAAALDGTLEQQESTVHPVFGLSMPVACPGVPARLLDPRRTWADGCAYDRQAGTLAAAFAGNFRKYTGEVSATVTKCGPKIL